MNQPIQAITDVPMHTLIQTNSGGVILFTLTHLIPKPTDTETEPRRAALNIQNILSEPEDLLTAMTIDMTGAAQEREDGTLITFITLSARPRLRTRLRYAWQIIRDTAPPALIAAWDRFPR